MPQQGLYTLARTQKQLEMMVSRDSWPWEAQNPLEVFAEIFNITWEDPFGKNFFFLKILVHINKAFIRGDQKLLPI